VRTIWVIVGLLIVAALAVLFYLGGGPQRPDVVVGPSSLAGAPAASFDVVRADGSPDALARYRGKVVLVNLWATWCPPCREEMPALETLYRAHVAQGFVVLGIDQGESSKVAADYARARGVTFPILIDDQQQYGRAYAAEGLPTSVLVDRTGHIVKGVDGEMSLAAMQALVTPVLKSP
jgi:cytochrome c biogenesis protein CcmG, thiol:disulfide interchange protein DsbE